MDGTSQEAFPPELSPEAAVRQRFADTIRSELADLESGGYPKETVAFIASLGLEAVLDDDQPNPLGDDATDGAFLEKENQWDMWTRIKSAAAALTYKNAYDHYRAQGLSDEEAITQIVADNESIVQILIGLESPRRNRADE